MNDIDLGTPGFGLHPLHGVHEPTWSTPPRRPNSLRRTTSVDMTRSPGTLDPVRLAGRGRDLRTFQNGRARVVGRAGMVATAQMVARVIESLDVQPGVDNLRLTGAPAMSGFRAAVDRAAPQLRQRRDLRYSLLDDVPVALLISGHALTASGALGNVEKSGYLPVADQCAGFVTGGLLMTSFEAGDHAVVTGPIAPEIDESSDSLAWHDMPTLPVHGMRRRRRLDVYPVANGLEVSIDAMFRDTYVREDASETVIHEYTLSAAVAVDSGVILRSHAVPRVLPWQECPGAVASAARIAGMTLDELHFRVRQELSGTSTCTHLNDLLRSVADARALIALLSLPC